MKKSLLALAVLGAFAGVASAQSSVTLFGVLDVNAQYLDNNGVKSYSMNNSGMNSSRLGFRGTEDLGGGMSAGFWLEGAMTNDDGATAQTWTRRSTVSLMGSWGEARFGRDYTSTFWNSTIFDPFGTNGVGSAGNLAFANPGLPPGGGYGTLVRASNMMGYFLPSGIAGGLYGQLQVAAGENLYGNKYWGGRIGYAKGPFNVAAAYGRTEVSNNVDGDQWNIGGSWNFGFLMLSAYYGEIEISSLDQTNWFIGAQAPIGLWTLKASYGQVSRSGSVLNNQDANQLAIGATYDLSKRTALYATWAGINNKDGARFGVGAFPNVTGGGLVANQDSSGMQLGIKHSF